MPNTVVLITGALTGIGRATAWLSPSRARTWPSPAGARRQARRWKPKCASSAPKPLFIAADVRSEEDVRQHGRPDRRAFRPAGRRGQLRRNRRQARPGDGADCGELHGDVRHQRARHAAQHEARTARDAGAGQRQHRQHLLDHGRTRRAEHVALHGQQACGGGPDQVRRARGGGVWRPRQRRRARPGGDRNAQPAHRRRRTESRRSLPPFR